MTVTHWPTGPKFYPERAIKSNPLLHEPLPPPISIDLINEIIAIVFAGRSVGRCRWFTKIFCTARQRAEISFGRRDDERKSPASSSSPRRE